MSEIKKTFFIIALIGSQYCFALQKDSVIFKKYNFGIEIPYSFIPQKNLELVSNQTALSGTTFLTGLSITFKYNFTKQIALQTGVAEGIGQYDRIVSAKGLTIGEYGHRFNEIQIPVKGVYTFNKRDRPLNLFVSAGYSLCFITNKTNHNSKTFDSPIPEETQLNNKSFQSLGFVQAGLIYCKTKIKPFVSFTENYSMYWKDYFSINAGAYF